MFNPFKKKEEDKSFKLDEYSLPSVSDQTGQPPAETPGTNPLPGADPMGPTDATSKFNPTVPEHQDNYDSYTGPSFPPAQSPGLGASAFEKQAQEPMADNTHQEISKAKIEALEAKVSLMDARLATIDQKLEVIYQMLAAEISEDTRRRLNVQSMVESAKRKQ